MRRFLALAILVCAAALATQTDYQNAIRKFRAIEKSQLKRGSRVALPANELNAYVQVEMAEVAPQGVRNPRIELQGNNIATGRALINFLKLQKAHGAEPNFLLAKLLDGERDVAVTVRVNSGAGKATVSIQRVEISGIPVEGATLDFLIQNYLLPRYPNAAINRPFELNYRMDRLEVSPGIAYVVMQK